MNGYMAFYRDKSVTVTARTEKEAREKAAKVLGAPSAGDVTVTIDKRGMPAMPELRFLIWSNEYRCFWGGPGQGNTWTLSQAGRYTEAEARSVCDRANAGLPAGEEPKEVMLLAPECLGMVGR